VAASWALLFVVLAGGPASALAADSCVDCHQDDRFLVQNSKLYNYYQEWKQSIHAQEGVSCVDCHGGDAEKADKKAAHGGDLSEGNEASRVNFRNIPSTCGECHEEVYEAYRTSKHAEHLVKDASEEQGPSCVTCDGSIDVGVIHVNAVHDSCARCENEESDNHPENAERARAILQKFLSIHRYYRYIVSRDTSGSKAFYDALGHLNEDLALVWHTFDLDEIERRTDAVLDVVKARRDEVRARQPKKEAR
jgi:hypothetical protein